jgi:hypothetical protein
MARKNNKINKIKEHLKEDIKTFDKEKADDKKLLKSLRKVKRKKK